MWLCVDDAIVQFGGVRSLYEYVEEWLGCRLPSGLDAVRSVVLRKFCRIDLTLLNLPVHVEPVLRMEVVLSGEPEGVGVYCNPIKSNSKHLLACALAASIRWKRYNDARDDEAVDWKL